MSGSEVERLRDVYADYRSQGHPQELWSDDQPGNRAMRQERSRELERLLDEGGLLPLSERRILEVGCGSGSVLSELRKWGASPRHLFGVDLLSDRIDEAARRFPELDFRQANAEALDFETASFDVVLLFTVLTSILEESMARNVAREVGRVLKLGGAVIWYDFRYDNPRNPNVRGMRKKEIRRLFPDFSAHLKTATLLPPLARRLGSLTPALYPVLTAVPLLRTHYLGLLIKRT